MVYAGPERLVGCFRLINWCIRLDTERVLLQPAVEPLLKLLWQLDALKVSDANAHTQVLAVV
jgi:hypothetical protein